MKVGRVVVALGLVACNIEATPGPSPASGSAAPSAAGVPKSASANAERAAPAPSSSATPDATSKIPFCEAALAKPMRDAIAQRCSEREAGSTLLRVIRQDARAVVRWCERALGQPERVTIDEAVAAACAPKIADHVAKLALDKTKSLQAFRELHQVAGCQGLVTGKQVAGAPCSDDAQCQAGLTCQGVTSDAAKEGSCAKPGQDGERCEWKHYSLDLAPDHAQCADALGCTSDDTCRPLAADGAACKHGSMCKSQYCLEGKCAQRAALGGPCDADYDCDSQPCVNGKCVERAKAGATCDETSECLGDCDDATKKCVDFCGSG